MTSSFAGFSQCSKCVAAHHALGTTFINTYRELRLAYLDKVRVHHPDIFDHDEVARITNEQLLCRINNAYSHLKLHHNDACTPACSSEDAILSGFPQLYISYYSSHATRSVTPSRCHALGRIPRYAGFLIILAIAYWLFDAITNYLEQAIL